jgi:DNA modification methylase
MADRSRRTSPVLALPNKTRNRNAGHSDIIRSKGLAKDHEFNVRWLREARRVLKPDGTLWVTGTHHIIFSIGFALQRLGYRIIKAALWKRSDCSRSAKLGRHRVRLGPRSRHNGPRWHFPSPAK